MFGKRRIYERSCHLLPIANFSSELLFTLHSAALQCSVYCLPQQTVLLSNPLMHFPSPCQDLKTNIYQLHKFCQLLSDLQTGHKTIYRDLVWQQLPWQGQGLLLPYSSLQGGDMVGLPHTLLSSQGALFKELQRCSFPAFVGCWVPTIKPIPGPTAFWEQIYP